MMSKSKTIFEEEWVRTSPMLSKRFGKGIIPKCELCGDMSCAPHWYSIKRKVFRCDACFLPKELSH